MQIRDILLITVALSGIAGGVALPRVGIIFSPYLLYFMMTILFFSFLRIDFTKLPAEISGSLGAVVFWSAWKLIGLPVAVWGICRLVMPDMALAAMLLAGVSSGVTAPFFAALLGARVPLVLQVVVVTSLLVPLTQPALARILMGAELRIEYWPMVRMLLMVIFIPLIAALLLRRLRPGLVPRLMRVQFPLILILFLVINLGVFARYAPFLRSQPEAVARVLGVCTLLALLFTASGFLTGWLSGRRLDGLDGAVLMTYVNNVLVVVYAARFFGALETLTAALYLLPLYMMLLPIRYVARRFNT